MKVLGQVSNDCAAAGLPPPSARLACGIRGQPTIVPARDGLPVAHGHAPRHPASPHRQRRERVCARSRTGGKTRSAMTRRAGVLGRHGWAHACSHTGIQPRPEGARKRSKTRPRGSGIDSGADPACEGRQRELGTADWILDRARRCSGVKSGVNREKLNHPPSLPTPPAPLPPPPRPPALLTQCDPFIVRHFEGVVTQLSRVWRCWMIEFGRIDPHPSDLPSPRPSTSPPGRRRGSAGHRSMNWGRSARTGAKMCAQRRQSDARAAPEPQTDRPRAYTRGKSAVNKNRQPDRAVRSSARPSPLVAQIHTEQQTD